MIDIKHLRENPTAYQDSADLRGVSVNIGKLLELDRERVELIGQVEKLRSELNVSGKPTPEQLTKLQETKAALEKLQSQLAQTDEAYLDLLLRVPNLIAEGTPEGGEEANREEKTWGEAKKPDFEVADHLTLSERNDWLDFERGAKVAGSKFLFLKGAAVKLERAVMHLAMDITEQASFTLISVPHLVTERMVAGTGYLPRGEEHQIYKIEGEDLNLIATSEIPITGYHADEIINPANLPLCYAGISPSYRVEGGAYGKYSKGYYRVHQFNKLEMYVFCRPQDSEAWHGKLLDLEEQICQKLEIPYRLVRIAAGDLGAPAYKKFDVEYWSPVEEKYRELMSCSNCTDYQARRLNVRTRSSEGKTEFVHTLNGTAIGFSRIFIALLENHQTADGKVKLPKALQPYYGGSEL
ncbi:MAG TPA: serine--tRNA ligase [Candidatus Saccharimonadales bacterium]|nr:serine--tRNA ligase [Candidatus Saccharimonadales bacterium]